MIVAHTFLTLDEGLRTVFGRWNKHFVQCHTMSLLLTLHEIQPTMVTVCFHVVAVVLACLALLTHFLC